MVHIGMYRFQYPRPKNVGNKEKTPGSQRIPGMYCGGWGKRTATPADLRKQCSQIFWGLNGAYLFDSNCAHA